VTTTTTDRRTRRYLRPLLALTFVVGVLAACSPFPSVGTDFGGTGPFAVSVREDAAHWYYYPTDLGAAGRKHPVLLWGNGTFLNPIHYDGLLRHLASHGFIVAAAYTTNAGSGQEMLAGLDNLTAFNADPASPFYRKVDLNRVGAVGHSQGGIGAMRAGADPRVDVAVPIEGASASIPAPHGPTLYLAGELDTLVPPAGIRAAYDATTGTPAAYAELRGADHLVPLVTGNAFRAHVTAFLRWHLMGDAIARDQFIGPCAYCSSTIWSAYETNPPMEALAP
jgi:dienelactone hydrolase